MQPTFSSSSKLKPNGTAVEALVLRNKCRKPVSFFTLRNRHTLRNQCGFSAECPLILHAAKRMPCSISDKYYRHPVPNPSSPAPRSRSTHLHSVSKQSTLLTFFFDSHHRRRSSSGCFPLPPPSPPLLACSLVQISNTASLAMSVQPQQLSAAAALETDEQIEFREFQEFKRFKRMKEQQQQQQQQQEQQQQPPLVVPPSLPPPSLPHTSLLLSSVTEPLSCANVGPKLFSPDFN
jgi:hypothetical protein